MGSPHAWDYYESSVIVLTQREGVPYVASGVLISSNIVLTAAHVVEEIDSCKVVLSHVLENNTHEEIEGDFDSITIHDEYDAKKSNFHADLAMFRLKQRAPQQIEYPKLSPDEIESTAEIELVGFGQRNHENRRTLTQVYLDEVKDDNLILKNSLSLLGDSGGPLYAWQDKSLYLAGIHSTKLDNESTAEVSVAEHYDWIIKNKNRLELSSRTK